MEHPAGCPCLVLEGTPWCSEPGRQQATSVGPLASAGVLGAVYCADSVAASALVPAVSEGPYLAVAAVAPCLWALEDHSPPSLGAGTVGIAAAAAASAAAALAGAALAGAVVVRAPQVDSRWPLPLPLLVPLLVLVPVPVPSGSLSSSSHTRAYRRAD